MKTIAQSLRETAHRLCIALLCVTLSAGQVFAGSMTLLGAGGKSASAPAYTGPGDVFSTSPFAAYSCSEAFTAAYAASLGNACDLVDSAAPTVVICTLVFQANGLVNLSGNYCVGSLTPAAKCAAATGGTCNISQAYDQTGNTRHAVQATAANQPKLTFSSTPTGTIPALNCGNGATSTFLLTAGSFTQAQPLTVFAVYIRNAGIAQSGLIGANSTAPTMGSAGTANNAQVFGGTSLTAAATDSVWHALGGLLNGNGTSSAINVDGTDATGAANVSGFSAQQIRICRSDAQQHAGLAAEAMIWAASSASTDRNALSANAHSAGRYNF